jgi:hypothetical protein
VLCRPPLLADTCAARTSPTACTQDPHSIVLASRTMTMMAGQSVVKAGARAMFGAAATIALHVVAMAIGLVIGVLDGHIVLSILIAELALFVVSFAAAIVMVIRSRGSAGVGVAVGWFAGAAGMAVVSIAVVVACVALALVAVALMLITMAL